MKSILIISCFCAALSLSSSLPTPEFFGGTKTPELFWYPTDSGAVVPALLHGKPSRTFNPKGIADDVKFYLYNSRTPHASTEVYPGCWACFTGFNKNLRTIIFAHGFSSDHLGGFGDGLRQNFAQSNEELNLIFINWGKLAAAPWYEFAADNTKPVGQWTSQLIEFMVSAEFARLSDITFTGHSLGSHVGNFVATNLTIGKLPAIHALDPALPLFGERPDSERIDPTDAEFVNVIHTSMGTLLDGGLAFTEPRGHVDFYPNSGKKQPGCGLDAFGACSHSRAHEYFGETAHRTGGFVGCEVDSWEDYQAGAPCRSVHNMGFSTPRTARGVFYLTTNGTPPYGIGAKK